VVTLRKAAAYSKKNARPYTRISKKKSKSYIKAVPPQKIVKFSMGLREAFDQGKLPLTLTLVSDERCQIRHNALEACRQYIHKKLEEGTSGQFFFRVIVFPHHIQREHRMLTGAGADRMSSGMVLSFGKAMGKAAMLREGGRIFFIAVASQKALKLARETYKEVRSKLPCRTKALFEEIKPVQ
jgi:large subunit ribosomal protein L10e